MRNRKLPVVVGMSTAVREGLAASLAHLPEELADAVSEALRCLATAPPVDAVSGLVLLIGFQQQNVAMMLAEYVAEGAAALARGESTIGVEAMARLLHSWTERGLTVPGGMAQA
ncbi:hypothetical protein NR798_24120 [Archangium gephyra]|uniref:hypothetical protein n=1 Tax=Archangium gephyra TaxID=48 RepID=UPI0035D511AD